MMKTTSKIAGYMGDLYMVQKDASGQGHAWRTVEQSELPASIREEIVSKIVDGNDDPDCYVASNGQHYRWIRLRPRFQM
jgi:hypothetical protein